MNKTAIMIDGGFFIKRYFALEGTSYDVDKIKKYIRKLTQFHTPKDDDSLYRIFYYDCHPLDKKVHNPITKNALDFSKSNLYKFKMELFQELKSERKLALRMGELSDSNKWQLSYDKLKELLSGKTEIKDLTLSDVQYSIAQKGVDMRLGLDIASLAYKKQVSQIILIAGDSDFVPAAKLARREGVDFILDPMWARVKPSLFEHIDGMKSMKNTNRKPKRKPNSK